MGSARLALLGSLFLLASLSLGSGRIQGPALDGVSKSTLDVINTAKSVDVYRLSKGTKRYGNPVRLSKAEVVELMAALQVTGELRKDPACRPTPGFDFEFDRLMGSATMSLCLQCDVVQFHHSDYNPTQVAGNYRGPDSVTIYETTASVTAVHTRLVKLVKKLFPKDAIVQGLH